MKVLVSSTEFAIIIDTEEISFIEWIMNIEAQYSLLEDEEDLK